MTTRRALVDREVDVGEDLERAVGLRQLRGGERRLAAGRRRGELDPGDLVGLPLALEPGHHLLGALEHRLRGRGLAGLGAHLVGLVGERLGLGLGVGPLALAALLVGLALGQVGLPAHVVDVDLAAVGVEVQHLVDGRLEQGVVVADHDQPALVRLEELAQPDDRVGVEVVGGLVEQQRLGAGEQDPGQLDAAALATGEGLQLLGEDPLLDAEAAGDRSRPRTRRRTRRRRAARRRRARSGASPARATSASSLPISASASRSRRTTSSRPRAERIRSRASTSGSPMRGSCGQVADLAGRLHRAGRGQRLAGEDLGEGGLAGAVAADQADLVAGGDPEADVLHEESCAGTDLELVGGDHEAG